MKGYEVLQTLAFFNISSVDLLILTRVRAILRTILVPAGEVKRVTEVFIRKAIIEQPLNNIWTFPGSELFYVWRCRSVFRWLVVPSVFFLVHKCFFFGAMVHSERIIWTGQLATWKLKNKNVFCNNKLAVLLSVAEWVRETEKQKRKSCSFLITLNRRFYLWSAGGNLLYRPRCWPTRPKTFMSWSCCSFHGECR